VVVAGGIAFFLARRIVGGIREMLEAGAASPRAT
jgi:hypothetical protein